jgi:hypothetical protein
MYLNPSQFRPRTPPHNVVFPPLETDCKPVEELSSVSCTVRRRFRQAMRPFGDGGKLLQTEKGKGVDMTSWLSITNLLSKV